MVSIREVIRERKRQLYYLLLAKSDLRPDLTDNEIDIAYYLSKDDDIQEILRKAKQAEVSK